MKIGILGLGSIGVRHLKNLQQLGHEVAAYDVTDCEPESRDEVISLADALVIATPTDQHCQDLLDCIATGKPVFCEKPIAGTHLQWATLHNFIGFMSTTSVMMGNNLRFHPCVIAAKDWVEALIEPPRWASFICAQLSSKTLYRQDGVILNWGAHEIDLALHLFGPARVACADAHYTQEGDDIADIVLEHASGTRSTIHLDYVTQHEVRRFLIAGEKANLGVDLLARTISPSNTYARWLGGSYDDDYLAEMRAFTDLGTVSGATGVDGLRTLDLILDAQRMARVPMARPRR